MDIGEVVRGISSTGRVLVYVQNSQDSLLITDDFGVNYSYINSNVSLSI